MELNEKTKKSIEKMVGLPFEKFLKMDPLQEKAYVEKKTGKTLGWKEGLKVDGLPIRTMEEVDKRMDKVIKEKGKER